MMGGGMMRKDTMMKKGGKIPPQLKKFVMAKNGLDKWFAQKWVDIGSKKKDGSFAKSGRSKQNKDAKRK